MTLLSILYLQTDPLDIIEGSATPIPYVSKIIWSSSSIQGLQPLYCYYCFLSLIHQISCMNGCYYSGLFLPLF